MDKKEKEYKYISGTKLKEKSLFFPFYSLVRLMFKKFLMGSSSPM